MTIEKAQHVRNFIEGNNSAVLCTISRSHQGYPFGSHAPYAIDSAGRPLIYISKLAEHYRNLEADSRACFYVAETGREQADMSAARASALGRFIPLEEAKISDAEQRYFGRFPLPPGERLPDFFFFAMEIERIRWIGGFGDIRWISAKDYAAVPPST